jgi:hypothetical protein
MHGQARLPTTPQVSGAFLVCYERCLTDATIVNVALPHIQHAPGFSGSGLEWVVNAYALYLRRPAAARRARRGHSRPMLAQTTRRGGGRTGRPLMVAAAAGAGRGLKK